MDNTDDHSNPDAERYASESPPGEGQPPHSTSITDFSSITHSLADLREAVVRLGVELTALSNELGDGNAFLGNAPIDPEIIDEFGIEELESTTDRLHGFRRDIHDQVAQLSETARFWLEQDATDIMPPEVPPGSPETTSMELDGPSVVPPRHPLLDPPRLLLGGSYHTPQLPEMAHLNFPNLLHTPNSHEYNGMPQLMNAPDSSDSEDYEDDAVNLNRARYQRSTRNPPQGPVSEYYGMPGLMSASESSGDERGATDGSGISETHPTSSDAGERGGAGVQEETMRPAPNLSYTRDPWVVPGTWMHQLLMQGQAPDDSSPPSLTDSEGRRPARPLETRGPHIAWRTSRMQKLLSSLEVLDDSVLERFCRVGGGGGEYSDQCMICWESLKVEHMEDRSCTAVEHALSEENGRTSTSAGNLSAASRTPTSSTTVLDGSGAAALPCLHVFHSKCLIPWFEKLATTCPVCRFDLDPHKLLLFSASPSFMGVPVAPPVFPQATDAHRESGRWTGSISLGRPVPSSSISPIPTIDGDNSWSSTDDSIPSLLSIPAQQDEQEAAGDILPEQSSQDSIPPLSESLADGAGDLPMSDPLTSQGEHTISPPTPSNGVSNLSNHSANDASDEEHPVSPHTHVDAISARDDTAPEEVNAGDPVHYASDTSTDVDSMPSLIAASEEPGRFFSFPGVGRNPRITRGENGEPPDELRRGEAVWERSRGRAANALTTPRTDNPQQAAFRNFAAETRTFLSEMQDTLLNAYVRFSNIREETAADAEILRAQASRWASLTNNLGVSELPPPSSLAGNAASLPPSVVNPPLWMSSQDAARREWVLPKGPVEGGVVNWINKREEEIRGDLE